MFSPVFIFLGSQLLFALIFGLLRLGDTRNLQRALLREQNAQGTRLERYLRFLAASRTIQRAGNNPTITVLFLILGGAGLVFPVLHLTSPNPTLSGSFQILQIEQLVVLALVIGFIGGSATEALFRLFKVEPKAWHLFESSEASSPSPSTKRTLITGIIKLLLLVLACEGLAAALMVSGNLTLAFPLFGTVITFVILLWPTRVSNRLVRSLPALEDTS